MASSSVKSQKQNNTFDFEQEHLTTTYSKLKEIKSAAQSKINKIIQTVADDKKMLAEDLTINLDSIHDKLETYANVVSLNNIVKISEMEYQIQNERLRAAELLLRKPYFAKIVFTIDGTPEEKELYIGSVGIVDKNRNRMVIDWRSPVAELYYNQTLGVTSYTANGRTIQTNLQLRRQFDITESVLKTYFDPEIAIEDKLLIKALSRTRTDKMRGITASIQREQNTIIRTPDVPALLISGVAGSGKTSVLMQRIAYLLYHNRDNLTAKQIVIVSPNPAFKQYINQVLPELGEQNPHIYTFAELKAQIKQASKTDDPEDLITKYVFVDEVQDYSTKELSILLKYFANANFILTGDPNQAITEGTASWREIVELFNEARISVCQMSLTVSYRSTPSITRLFKLLLPKDEALKISSIERRAQTPEVYELHSKGDWLQKLNEVVYKTAKKSGLTAIITPDKKQAKEISKLLTQNVTIIKEDMLLPVKGLIVIALKLAKGLEFDHVIIPDASELIFPKDELSRRRLYATISRATKELTILANGSLTPLLKEHSLY